MAALAPTVSTLLAAQGRVVVEVCSGTGTRLVVLNGGHSEQQPADTHGGKHCPYCWLQQDQATPPVQITGWRAPQSLAHDRPWSLPVYWHVRTAWVHLPSRAPPDLMV